MTMKYDDGIPDRQPIEPEPDSAYVAALRPIAELAFAPMVNYGTKPCEVCGNSMIAYSRRKVCIDCYPAWSKQQQNEMRVRRRARKREEASG